MNMMSTCYNLDDNNLPVSCSMDRLEWDDVKKVVGFSEINNKQISTVFLFIDHNHSGGTPILYETMIFGGDFQDLHCDRCSTLREALRQHKEAVIMVIQGKI